MHYGYCTSSPIHYFIAETTKIIWIEFDIEVNNKSLHPYRFDTEVPLRDSKIEIYVLKKTHFKSKSQSKL
jgi:hypothetical protein